VIFWHEQQLLRSLCASGRQVKKCAQTLCRNARDTRAPNSTPPSSSLVAPRAPLAARAIAAKNNIEFKPIIELFPIAPMRIWAGLMRSNFLVKLGLKKSRSRSKSDHL
jgi:hypothetical protein